MRPAMVSWRRAGPEQEAHPMSIAEVPTASVMAWGQVAAAIVLVASGRYPRVIVANIGDASRLVLALREDAERCGVALMAEVGADGCSTDIVVRRR
jgi:hypothetical protein